MKIRIEQVNKIFANNNHNAFTDIISWKGKFYLAFRTGELHGSFDGKIVVLCSSDAENWFEVTTLSSENEDNRDPKFLAYRDKLFLYSPTRYDRTENSWKVKTMVTYTSDGHNWTPFKMAKRNYVFWRPKTFGGTHYVAGYTPVGEKSKLVSRKLELWKTVLFRSTDGLSWEEISTIHQGDGVNETDIEFLPDGKVIALSRLEASPHHPMLAISEPPYQKWEKFSLNVNLQGPMLRKVNNEFIVVGRTWLEEEKPSYKSLPKTGIFQLKNNKLVKLAILPSGGDTSYAGSIVLPDNKMLISYYSTHETSKSAIYLANIKYWIEMDNSFITGSNQ